MLDSKRNMCEEILDQCVEVRQHIWTDFIRDIAPELRLAELNLESRMRQSCLGDISDCIQKACREDIAGTGQATMDACLARPDMARSFCRVQLDPCERMEPQIWDYVVSRLAALRVDRCTEEVRECFASPHRCGPDFSNCIGMDFAYLHNMCPLDSLVVCRQARPNFSMSDLDDMLMGFYLNVDNAALENCENLVEAKMLEVCGSTTDCNKFASDDIIGTGSLVSGKDGDIYRVKGLIAFGNIQVGDIASSTRDGGQQLGVGRVGVQDYIRRLRGRPSTIADSAQIIDRIESELENIAGTINRTIDLIESDQRIQYCIQGRDLSQITGVRGQATTGRFPNLLNSTKMIIASAALRQANDNYNRRYEQLVKSASESSSVDLAAIMCAQLPNSAGVLRDLRGGGMGAATADQDAIYIEFAAIPDRELAQLGPNRVQTEIGIGGRGGNREMWTTFDRNTRTCTVCRVDTTCSGSAQFRRRGQLKRERNECVTGEERCDQVRM